MSTLTKIWTIEKFKRVLKSLDMKTGLSGAMLDVYFMEDDEAVGCFDFSSDSWCFRFSEKQFNDPNFKELAAIETIRHEYAHYYNHIAKINELLPNCKSSPSGHGEDWAFACKMINIDPNRCYDSSSYDDKDITVEEARNLLMANDVEQINILEYITRWNRLPLTRDEYIKSNNRLENMLGANALFKPTDKIEHCIYGEGVVSDVRPGVRSQLVYAYFYKEGYRLVNNKVVRKSA